MKRIMSIAYRDLINNLKDFMVLYITIAPILIAIIFTSFLPSVESSTATFIVDNSIDSSLINELEKYASVETVKGKSDIYDRVLGIDDVAGLTFQNGNYEIIKEGNEATDWDELLKIIINKYESSPSKEFVNRVSIQFSDIGYEESPSAIIGTISIIIMCIAIAGMIIGLNIVLEKDADTIRALNVTPLSKVEFIIGKSLMGCIISLIQIFIVMILMGYSSVNLLMIFIFSIVNLLIVILFGFLTGVTSPNQMAAIANMKILFLPISISIVGAILIPASKQFLLYWSPFYWTYLGYQSIINQTANWLTLSYYSLWIILITTLLFIAFKKRINVRLN